MPLAPNIRTALFCLGLLLSALTGLHNIGIIGIDDYINAIALMIPAQRQEHFWESILEGPHPPIPRVIAHFVGRLPLLFGITDPVTQLRLALCLLGIGCYCVVVATTRELFAQTKSRSSVTKQDIVLAFCAFYFAAPLFFSRSMNESLSIPFVCLSLFFATRYFLQERSLDLALSVGILGAGALVRYQVGACIFAVLILVAMKRRLRDWGVFAGVGALAFLLTGLSDFGIGRTFHESLRNYVEYNQRAGELHGVTPFYTFILLWLGLSLPPTFFSRYRGIEWKKEYRPLIPALLFFGIFLVVHSASPHKEERFMVPMLPVFFVLLTPLVQYFLTTPGHRWRIVFLGGLNAVLLVGTCYNVPQKNIIDLARFAGDSPQIQKIYSVATSVVFFPGAYTLRPVGVEQVTDDWISIPESTECSSVVAVRYDVKKRLGEKLDQGFDKIAAFEPGVIEQLLVWANEANNSRRGRLELYRPKRCTIEPS